MAKAWRKALQATLIALGAVSAASALAGTAEAHDAVIGGDPANGSVVTDFPGVLTLEFSGQPQDGFNTFALSRVSDNEILFTGNQRLTAVSCPWSFLEQCTPLLMRFPVSIELGSRSFHQMGTLRKE